MSMLSTSRIELAAAEMLTGRPLNGGGRLVTPEGQGYTFVRWSGPELGTNLGTNSLRRKFDDGQLLERNGGLGRD
jgi:hypothetical protein